MVVFMRQLGQVWRCAALYRSARYEEAGLDIGAYQDTYLRYVCSHPGTTQEQISQSIYVNKSNVARQIASLEEKGYVVRQVDEQDRRNLLIFPTQKGVEALEKIKVVQREWNARLLEGLSDTEIETVVKYVDLLADRARNVIEQSGEKKSQ